MTECLNVIRMRYRASEFPLFDLDFVPRPQKPWLFHGMANTYVRNQKALPAAFLSR